MILQTIRQKQIFILLVLALLLAACNPSTGSEPVVSAPTSTTAAPDTAEPTATTEPTTPADLTEATLDSLAYQGIYNEPVQLTGGLFEGEPLVEGGASRPTVTRLPLAAFGDLNGDGVEDAAVLLVENSGGSGSFVYLAAVINQASIPENVATILLGDRVSPQSLAIAEGQIVVEATSHADSDPLCCPSLTSRSIYALQEQLTLISNESSPGASLPAELAGKWYWLAYEDTAGQNNIKVADPSLYTITFQADGTVEIQADCNSAGSVATIEGNNISLAAGPTTLAECAPGSLYNQYLAKLADVATFVFDQEGHLVLNLKIDAGNIVFGREVVAE